MPQVVCSACEDTADERRTDHERRHHIRFHRVVARIQWGEAVVRCHDDYDADDVVVEVCREGAEYRPRSPAQIADFQRLGQHHLPEPAA
jgi:hypothetical protein